MNRFGDFFQLDYFHGIINASDLEKKNLNEISVNAQDRWRIVRRILAKNLVPADHFLHIPKTAGTTLAESLQSDRRRVVISVDAPFGQFLGHLLAAHENPMCLPILTRSHHHYSALKTAGCMPHFRTVFTGFRPAVSIHVSNVNMLMSRLKKFYLNEVQNVGIKQFCEQWDLFLKDDSIYFDYTKKIAIEILSSNAYLRTYSGIYSRYFRHCTEDELDAIKFIHFKDFDRLLTGYFGYESAPARRNSSDSKLIVESDCNEHLKKSLLADDLQILPKIRQRLLSSEQVEKLK